MWVSSLRVAVCRQNLPNSSLVYQMNQPVQYKIIPVHCRTKARRLSDWLFNAVLLEAYSVAHCWCRPTTVELRCSRKKKWKWNQRCGNVRNMVIEVMPPSTVWVKKDQRYFSLITLCQILVDFYSAAALIAMQSAVIATAIPSVRLSVRLSHADTLSRRMKIE